jgi:hypothetical protein
METFLNILCYTILERYEAKKECHSKLGRINATLAQAGKVAVPCLELNMLEKNYIEPVRNRSIILQIYLSNSSY